MAKALVDQLSARGDVTSVSWLNDFSSLGPLLGRVLARGFRFHLGQGRWTYDLAYAVFSRLSPARAFGEWALQALGASSLLESVRAHQPDVVVSTYPVMNPVLARLRVTGRLRCPVAAVVGPVGGLCFWVQPHIDLHLALYPEAVAEINRLAGRDSALAVRALVRDEFFTPSKPGEARDALGLDRERTVVLISGGGWGAGDLAGAIAAALSIPGAEVIAVSGRNETGRAALASRYEREPRVTLLGFTDRMRDLLCAADVFVTATAGLSCLEAQLCGCPTVCYGFAVGHVRDNTAAIARHGLGRTAATPSELELELRRTLAAGRPPLPDPNELPEAGEQVAELARSAAVAGR